MRQEWAVTAAEHLLAALRTIQSETGDVTPGIVRERIEPAYWGLIFAIGTIPGDRLDFVREMTVEQGWDLAAALDAVGA